MGENAYTEDFFETLFRAENTADLRSLLEGIMTESEIQTILVRWGILNDLKKNVPQRKIASEYGTSLAKINKCSALLKNKSLFITALLDDRYDESHIKEF